jgi:cytochrome c
MHNPPMIPARNGISKYRLLWAVAAAVLIAGCGFETDDRPAKWSFISATIIQPSCATVNCHSEVANRAGVDLHDRATGYKDLVDRRFVIPGDQTGSSSLLYLLQGRGSISMPPDAPIPAVDTALIDEWIRAGAPND